MATSKLLLAAADNLMGKVHYRYLEAGLFMFQPKNLLLPNLPDPAEYKPSPSTANIVISSNTIGIIEFVLGPDGLWSSAL
ncbi:MAG: hypothetical protein WCD60_12205 [Pseudolabrys sp.]